MVKINNAVMREGRRTTLTTPFPSTKPTISTTNLNVGVDIRISVSSYQGFYVTVSIDALVSNVINEARKTANKLYARWVFKDLTFQLCKIHFGAHLADRSIFLTSADAHKTLREVIDSHP